MKGMVSIEELEACTIELSHESILPETTGFSFPRLKRLAMTRLDDDRDSLSLEMMEILLKLSPNIEALRIDGTWRPRLTMTGLRAIGDAKLKSIALSREEVRQGESIGGVVFRDFDQVEMGMEEVAVEAAVDEANELDLNVSCASARY